MQTIALLRLATFVVVVVASLQLTTVQAQRTAQSRSSCETLSDCNQCIKAGCTWSEPFSTSPPQVEIHVSRSFDEGSCVESCDRVGTAANCFLGRNYVGLTSEEVCAIATHTNPTTVPVVVYVQGQEINVEPLEKVTEAPSPAPSLGFMSEVFTLEDPNDIITNVTETNTATTTTTTLNTTDTSMNTTDANTNTTTTTMNESPEVSCAGFIACEECPDNGMACAYVAWDCGAYCPELAHIPCFEVEGNYSDMTAEDVCVASIEVELIEEEEQDLSDMSVSAMRIGSAARSSMRQARGVGMAMSVAVLLLCSL